MLMIKPGAGKLAAIGKAPRHSAEDQPQVEVLLLALPLSQPQRHRTHVLSLEGLPPPRPAVTATPSPSTPPSASQPRSATGYEAQERLDVREPAFGCRIGAIDSKDRHCNRLLGLELYKKVGLERAHPLGACLRTCTEVDPHLNAK